jgi:hypothetical protein
MVTKGKNQFGGTMKMLGAMTTKVCYWLRAGGGGCSLGLNDWRYDAIGAAANTSDNGMVTMGYDQATNYTRYYNTRLSMYSAVTAVGSRFPWTTGKATITAIARGPHKTVHYAKRHRRSPDQVRSGAADVGDPDRGCLASRSGLPDARALIVSG